MKMLQMNKKSAVTSTNKIIIIIINIIIEVHIASTLAAVVVEAVTAMTTMRARRKSSLFILSDVIEVIKRRPCSAYLSSVQWRGKGKFYRRKIPCTFPFLRTLTILTKPLH